MERKARLIHVFSFRFLSYAEPVGQFRLKPGTKGTYVRVISMSLAVRLLRRPPVITSAHSLRQIQRQGRHSPLEDLVQLLLAQRDMRPAISQADRAGMTMKVISRRGMEPGRARNLRRDRRVRRRSSWASTHSSADNRRRLARGGLAAAVTFDRHPD